MVHINSLFFYDPTNLQRMFTLAQDVTNFSDKTFFLLIILGATWLLGQEIRARYIRNPRRLPLPPGPKGLPLIGNLLNRPTDRTWLVYRDWAKIYGKFTK